MRRVRGRVGRVIRSNPPLAPTDLAMDGQAVMTALGIGPGRAVGDALRHLLERVLADPALNTRDVLESELRVWWKARAGAANGTT